jgi:DNA polymerase
MLACAGADSRARGLLQFYGANRTGRWAGRLVQVQNLPQNHLRDLDLARTVVRSGDPDLAALLFDDIGSVLSQLVRTAFVAKPGHTLAVADFSAIEARVIAWLAGEDWRMQVFNTHGKIYEASAAMMFRVPIESVTKGSDLRQKGKIAELADHPWMLGTQFHPEFKSRPNRPHPLFRDFVGAAHAYRRSQAGRSLSITG